MGSDYLRHFAENDPPSTSSKEAERKTVAQKITEYLASGGIIKDVGNESAASRYPVKRTKKDQIAFIRRRDYLGRHPR